MTDTAFARVAQLRADASLTEVQIATAPPPPQTTGHGLQAVQRPRARALVDALTSARVAPVDMLDPSPQGLAVAYQAAFGTASDLDALLDSLDAPASPWFRIARWERLPWEAEFYADRQDQTLLVVVLPPMTVQVVGDGQAAQCSKALTIVVVDLGAGPAVLSLPEGSHVILERDSAASAPTIAILSPTADACRIPDPPLERWLDEVADDPWLVSRINREATEGPWGRVLAAAMLWRLSRSAAESTRRAVRRFASGWTTPQSGAVLRQALDATAALREALASLHAHALAESVTRVQVGAARRNALEGVLVLLYAAQHAPGALHEMLATVDAVAHAALLAFDDPDVLDPEHSTRTSLPSPGAWWTGAYAEGVPDDGNEGASGLDE